MGFAKRLFRSSQTATSTAEPMRSALVAGRVTRARSADVRASESADLAALLFGRGLVKAPSGWLTAPVAGVVSDALAGQVLPGSDVFCVQLAPGWARGVLEQLSARFFVVETAALVESVWAGALDAGGEHLFDELLALVEQAKQQKIMPVLLDNADDVSVAPAALTTASAMERLRQAVPAVLDAHRPGVEESGIVQVLRAYAAQGGARA